LQGGESGECCQRSDVNIMRTAVVDDRGVVATKEWHDERNPDEYSSKDFPCQKKNSRRTGRIRGAGMGGVRREETRT